jgi:membrane protein DedA with SNARE-associated domain
VRFAVAAERRRTEGLDRLLMGSLALWVALGYVGRAVAPTLLQEAPRLLLVVDQRFPSQVLAADAVGSVSFVVFATLGISLFDPVAFLLGRRQGLRATTWAERRLPTTFRVTQWFERILRRTAGAPVMLLGGLPACALAGASGLSWRAFATFDAIGVVIRLVGVLGLLAVAPEQVDRLGSVVAERASTLTMLAIAWVLVDLWLGRRRRLRSGSGEPPPPA